MVTLDLPCYLAIILSAGYIWYVRIYRNVLSCFCSKPYKIFILL